MTIASDRQIQPHSIRLQDLNTALTELDFKSSDWFRTTYGDAAKLCIESSASRCLLMTLSDNLVGTMRAGGDYSALLVQLAAIMLQTGYNIGRRQAEAQVLEGWMQL